MSKLTSTTASTASFLVQRLTPTAKLPTRGSALAAGYDLYSAEAKVVPGRGKALINTELAISVPEGTYGRVAPRSGLGQSMTFCYCFSLRRKLK
jgi:dUTP pyrophosphatase